MSRSLAALIVALALVTGCAANERPRLGVPVTAPIAEQPVDDPNVQSVLDRLDTASTATFTARYRVLRKLGGTRNDAQVSQGPKATSVTIAGVRMLKTEAREVTCRLAAGACEDGLLDQRISDTGVTAGFWANAPAKRLRLAFGRRTGDATSSTVTVGGVAVSCVDVPVGIGAERYCATPQGPIGLWDAADVRVELVSIEPTADTSQFAVPQS